MNSLISSTVVPPLIALIVSAVMLALLLRGRVAAVALDLPNQRSLHVTPTPRLGGIGIVTGVAAAWIYAPPDFSPLLIVALLTLVVISFIDDIRSVNAGLRLIVHLASAFVAVAAVAVSDEWWWLVLAAVGTAWMINLYNFMDGSDGLAGGMAVIGFGCYGLAAALAGDHGFAVVNWCVAAAALGFLAFNFPPARVFMGDAGSIPLGCLAAVLHIAGMVRGDWAWWFGGVVFSPFIVDATVTLAKRMMRGARVWEAHREHFYQRLVQSGWGHRKTACIEYALMTACAALALGGLQLESEMQAGFLCAVGLAYAALAVALDSYLGSHDKI